MITAQHIEQYWNDGYTIVRGAIPMEVIDALRAAADALVEESRHAEPTDRRFEFEPDHTPQRPRLRRFNHPVSLHEVFWQTASGQHVLDCLEPLIGRDIRFHHSKLNMKAEKGGAQIGWHQDFAFFPHTNFDVVGCGIPLDPSNRDNGCLLVIPGTHKLPVLSHRDEHGEFVGLITDTPAVGGYDPARAVPVELEPGDMSIHNAMVVHGSLTNQSGQQRRLLIFEYAACDALELEHRPKVNDYNGRVVRGLPPTHARLAGDLRLPIRGDTSSSRSLFDRQARRAGAMM